MPYPNVGESFIIFSQGVWMFSYRPNIDTEKTDYSKRYDDFFTIYALLVCIIAGLGIFTFLSAILTDIFIYTSDACSCFLSFLSFGILVCFS